MIDYFSGILSSKTQNNVIIEVSGVGYNVSVTNATAQKLPGEGKELKLYIVESTGMYGGLISHYGFLSKDEREMFILIKDEVPSTGAKKAMEYLDKISKSYADFKTAVVSRDVSMLCGIFGFTKKTAEKITAALKDKIAGIVIADAAKWDGVFSGGTNISEAIEGLIALGYKEPQARTAVTKTVNGDAKKPVEEIIRESLKYL